MQLISNLVFLKTKLISLKKKLKGEEFQQWIHMPKMVLSREILDVYLKVPAVEKRRGRGKMGWSGDLAYHMCPSHTIGVFLCG